MGMHNMPMDHGMCGAGRTLYVFDWPLVTLEMHAGAPCCPKANSMGVSTD